MNPASRVSKGVTCRNGDALSGLEVQGKNSIRDLQNAVKTMELDPLVLPSTICLFCLDNDKLTSTAGTASFSRIDSLRRNIDGVRLSYYNQDVPIVCPYPSCDTALQGVNRFKNHAAEVKYESRACMERKSGDPWDYWYYFSVGLLESVDGGALAGLRTLYGCCLMGCSYVILRQIARTFLSFNLSFYSSRSIRRAHRSKDTSTSPHGFLGTHCVPGDDRCVCQWYVEIGELLVELPRTGSETT